MQKLDKGLARDIRPQDQPDATYPYGKNGVQELHGSQTNEPGFLPSSAAIPYTVIGVIETDKFPVIVSTDNVNSAFGYYDVETDTYTPIFNDVTKTFKLGLNLQYFVTGQAQRNYKGEVVIACTDNHVFPIYLNCDVPVIESLDDLRLFPKAQRPEITNTVIENGGILPPGAYYILGRYAKFDGTETSFLVSSDVIILPGATGVNTGKGIQIEVRNADPDFDLVQIGIISKVAGVTSAFTIEPANLSGSGAATIMFSGSNITTPATLEELLVDPVVYSKVRCIGQLNDALYIGNMEREPEVKMQKYALLVQLRWASKLISLLPRNEGHASARERGFRHREVYAFYIRYSKTSGGWTELCTLPGPVPQPADLVTSTEGTTGGLTARKFQVEDTIPSFDPGSKKGSFGVWENETETYPDTEDYDASDIGGPNIRAQKVRHFRFPSLGWCKQNLYNLDSSYGRTSLDLLGLEVSNIVIPANLTGQLDGGYEIYFAKRNTSNSTVLGQSLLIHAARGGKIDGTITNPDNDYISTGGNWHAQVDWAGTGRERPLAIDRRLFRFHDFDILLNKPAIAPAYLAFELKHSRQNLPDVDGFIEDYRIPPGHRNGPITYLLDYMTKGTPAIVAPTGKKLRKVAEYQYAPNNLFVGKWKNIQQETAFVGRMEGPPILDPSEISLHNLWTGELEQRADKVARFEYTYLMNLMALTANLYLPFNSQPVARCGTRKTGTFTFFNGDSFVSDYTFHTYGWNDQDNNTYAEDNASAEFMGIKTVRRIAVETSSNLYTRFETPGNIYSRYYPVSPLANRNDSGSITNYPNLFSRNFDPNQFGYNKDSNALNDLITAVIFNPQREDIRIHPFRVHRGGKLSRQLKKRSWRTFLPLDYFECQKNLDVIIHLEGMDDKLFIHHKKALTYTQDKLKLEQGTLSVTIGSGDIFQFEPQEALATKLGYAGTQHQLACVRTPIGYIFVDAAQGQVFIYKGGLRLINEYMNRFLEQYIRVKGTNPFIGDGITIGYDPQYKRVLLTAKQKILPQSVPLQLTQEFIDTLTPGSSLVTYEGRLLKFLGVNNTEYQCPSNQVIIIPNLSTTIPENTVEDTMVLEVIPTSGSGLSYFIVGGNPDNTFRIDAATGKIYLTNEAGIDYEVRQQFILQIKAVDADGQSVNFTATINITQVNEPPVSGNQEFSIPETIANGGAVGALQASDPENDSLSYAITAGNEDGIFSINPSTGAITIADNTLIAVQSYLLTVTISDGTNVISVQVTVNVTEVDEAPEIEDDTITIPDTTPTGTEVYKAFAQDPEGEIVQYAIVSASVPGIFVIDSATGSITLVDNALLNPYTTPQVVLTIRVSDTSGNQDTGNLAINIIYDPATLEFRPGPGMCSGGCPPGWTETDDGLLCERLTTIAATPPTGGPPITVAAATNGAYCNFGAFIYGPGYDEHGVGTIVQWLQNSPVWANPATNLLDGPLNRAGVWGATAVPDNEPIGFSIPITISETKTFYIGIAGDNKCRVALDGTTIIDQDPNLIGSSIEDQLGIMGQGIAMAFKGWHLYPVVIPAGTHFLGMEGINFGSAAGFAAEIYDNTIAEIMAATLKAAYTSDPVGFPLNQNYYDNLNLIFTTRSTRGGTFTSGISGGYSCPVGYALDGTALPTPECVLVEHTPAKKKLWTTMEVYSERLDTVLQILPNQAGQTFQGMPVPYYPPVENHEDCGGTAEVFYSVSKSGSAQRNNCGANSLGSIVTMSVAAGAFTSLVSQEAADDQAQAYIDANKQAYANANGFCSEPGDNPPN